MGQQNKNDSNSWPGRARVYGNTSCSSSTPQSSHVSADCQSGSRGGKEDRLEGPSPVTLFI